MEKLLLSIISTFLYDYNLTVFHIHAFSKIGNMYTYKIIYIPVVFHFINTLFKLSFSLSYSASMIALSKTQKKLLKGKLQ